MKKCDVVIPVYNSPEWVKLCVYSVMVNTKKEDLNKIILIDDCSKEPTKILLNNLKEKYKGIIEVLTNEKNLGFIKSVNKGLKHSSADYVLLLNTDCMVTKNTISKLMNYMITDENIGLICPISSNAANLTLDMFEGFNFSQMNTLLEQKFEGLIFDACTIVGNCLMISKKCMNDVGYLDEAYGTGYGEETDYQFKCMEKGYSAKVAIDTYVFHKSEVSFGTSKEKQEKLKHNREIFFSRWGEQYNAELKKYEQNDPIKYIHANLTDDDKKIDCDMVIYLPDIVQNAGGVHVVVDMINYLSINGMNCNILYNNIVNYQEIMLFNPINYKNIKVMNAKYIVSTIYSSTFLAKKISDELNCPLVSFIQGYEGYFENGSVYGTVELSYKLADYHLVISEYLKKELHNTFGYNSKLIANGINYDLLARKNENKSARTITFVLRNNVMKGDWLLLDIIKKLGKTKKNVEFNIIYMNEYIEFPNLPSNVKINKYLGPLNRSQVNQILQATDIYVDASLSEGFGLMALEAMTCGAIPVISNSFGCQEYILNNKNGYVINDVNNSDKFVEIINNIITDDKLFKELNNNLTEYTRKFDYDDVAKEYIKFFEKLDLSNKKNISLNEEEKTIYNHMCNLYELNDVKRRKVYYIAKIIPKSVKNRMKKFINFLYNMYQH